MSVAPLSLLTLPAAVEQHPLTLVDVGAAWCAPCRRFSPIFEAAAGRHPDVFFGSVDTDAEQELAAVLGIRSLPTLLGFRDGALVFRKAGVAGPGRLDAVIAEVRGAGGADALSSPRTQNG